MDKEQTVVVFRKFNDGGDIIAIFPEDPWAESNTCSSYMHIGQHGAVEPYFIVNVTTLATPEEYDSLKKELQGRGYNLKIVKKITQKHHEKRIDKLNQIEHRYTHGT